MAEAPPPPLPANPRPSRPSPKNSAQALREAMMLHVMERKQLPNNQQEDMRSSLMSGFGRMFGTGWRELLRAWPQELHFLAMHHRLLTRSSRAAIKYT